MDIELIEVPYDSGHRALRMGAGPAALVDAGLVARLESAGHVVARSRVETDVEFPTEADVAFDLAARLAERVAAARDRGGLPFVLSGNCMMAAGVVAGLRRAAGEAGEPDRTPLVVWLDAHGDLNTPETTRSGFLDGMAVSVVLGRCWTTLAAERLGLRSLPSRALVMLGVRDLDPAEVSEFERGEIRHVAPAGLSDALADARSAAPGEDIYLHIDLDVLDPSVGRANAYAAEGGLTTEQVLSVVDATANHGHIAAATLSAYDPQDDTSGGARDAALRIAERVAARAGGRQK
ncbi:MAG: arginase family protein [Longimicrobiales bacterium]